MGRNGLLGLAPAGGTWDSLANPNIEVFERIWLSHPSTRNSCRCRMFQLRLVVGRRKRTLESRWYKLSDRRNSPEDCAMIESINPA